MDLLLVFKGKIPEGYHALPKHVWRNTKRVLLHRARRRVRALSFGLTDAEYRLQCMGFNPKTGQHRGGRQTTFFT